MFHNYLLIAVRNLRRNKLFTVIHLAGLSIGMAGCILILLYIQEEFRYANYHSKGDRVFRVLRGSEKAGGSFVPNTSGAITPAMLRDFPEVEAAARLLDDWWFQVRHGDKGLELDVALGDAALLEMFDIELLQGDRATVLDRPNTVVITEGTAKAFFGDKDPIGKVLTVKDDLFPGDFMITGVMQNMSRYATVAFDALTTFPSGESPQSFKNLFESWRKTSDRRPFRNYIMLREGINAAQVEAKLPEFEVRHLGEEFASRIRYRLQPINRIRHYSEVDFGMTAGHPWGANETHPRPPRGIHRIHRLALVGLVILLIACFNFMNLATAQSTRRAREVGLRKVVGAGRGQLVRQFLVEAVTGLCGPLTGLCVGEVGATPIQRIYAGESGICAQHRSGCVPGWTCPCCRTHVGQLSRSLPVPFRAGDNTQGQTHHPHQRRRSAHESGRPAVRRLRCPGLCSYHHVSADPVYEPERPGLRSESPCQHAREEVPSKYVIRSDEARLRRPSQRAQCHGIKSDTGKLGECGRPPTCSAPGGGRGGEMENAGIWNRQ